MFDVLESYQFRSNLQGPHLFTGYGVAVGPIVGFICSISAWLIYASQLDGGLNNFRDNTAAPEPLITGLATGIIVGGITCGIISLCCGGCDKNRIEEEEWEKCRKVSRSKDLLRGNNLTQERFKDNYRNSVCVS